MTLQQALNLTDELMPNTMERATKIGYLSQIDGLIYHEILLTHEHTPEQEVCPEYDSDTDQGTVLLVPDNYAEDLYTNWLFSKIDLQNREMDMYNNHRALFENAYDTMHDWWNRTYMPVQRNRQLWI